MIVHKITTLFIIGLYLSYSNWYRFGIILKECFGLFSFDLPIYKYFRSHFFNCQNCKFTKNLNLKVTDIFKSKFQFGAFVNGNSALRPRTIDLTNKLVVNCIISNSKQSLNCRIMTQIRPLKLLHVV